jgi:DNA polymerase-1
MPKSLYIIDGHAQIYRSYFAVSGLTSPTGEPTNATFGFVAMLLKLYLMRKPTHVVLAMDAGAAARTAMSAAYKAQRKPMPEDMPVQIERIRQIVEILGMPVLQSEGCEADDVIATIVRQIRNDPAHADTMLYMCTKDKDLDQLIDERTRLFDIQTAEELDRNGLFAKKGFYPEQARDVLALTGDSVDNIPGIPGVGPKTAAKWITEYGTLANLIAHAADLKGKIGETFRANVGVLDQSAKLVELMFDLPVHVDWDASTVDPRKFTAVAGVFEELGFNKLRDQLDGLVRAYRQGGTDDVAAPAPARPVPSAAQKPPQLSDMPGGLFSSGAQVDAVTGDDTPSTSAAETDPTAAPNLQLSRLTPTQGDYHLINTRESLTAMLATLHQQLADSPHAWLSIDTETDALGAMRSNLCGICLSAKEGTGYYIALKGQGDCLPIEIAHELLSPILADPAIKKIGQNLKYDLNALRVAGFPFAGMHLDTMVLSYILDSSRLSHGMDSLAADMLNLQTIPISDVIGKGASQLSFADVPLDRATQYAAEDADVTLRLAHHMFEKLADAQLRQLLFDVEMPLVQVLADMEFFGVRIDAALLRTMGNTIEGKLVTLRQQIRDAAGMDFNFDSPKQLANVLFTVLKLPIVKKTKTGPSTDIEVLEKLSEAHPVPRLIVEYRQLTKLKNTYVDTLADQINARTGRVHASFNQAVAATGRLSSSDPNLQNIPIRTEIGREIRKAFIAGHENDVLITADYSQIELRMLAHYCQDPALLTAFAEDRDVHRVVAAEIFNVPLDAVTPEFRSVAKTVNFGIIYGQTGFGLAQVLKIPQDQANQFIAAYKRRFPRIGDFSNQCVREATMQGYVSTILGRRRLIPDINSTNPARRQFGQRAAMNSVIQGSAADLIKIAMVRLHARCAEVAEKTPFRLLMQIHDELVVECAAENAEPVSELIRETMVNAMPLRVPLKVDVGWGTNWLEG